MFYSLHTGHFNKSEYSVHVRGHVHHISVNNIVMARTLKRK